MPWEGSRGVLICRVALVPGLGLVGDARVRLCCAKDGGGAVRAPCGGWLGAWPWAGRVPLRPAA